LEEMGRESRGDGSGSSSGGSGGGDERVLRIMEGVIRSTEMGEKRYRLVVRKALLGEVGRACVPESRRYILEKLGRAGGSQDSNTQSSAEDSS
jgi:hypothetical protein